MAHLEVGLSDERRYLVTDEITAATLCARNHA